MFEEIKTKTITVPGERGEAKKAKLFITLKRHPRFFENIKKFNEIREQNNLLREKYGLSTDKKPESGAT